MLSEMIKTIAEMAVKTVKFESFGLPDGQHVLVRSPDGKVEKVEIFVPRNYEVLDLNSLLSLIAQLSDDSAIIFVDGTCPDPRAVCFLDEGDRRDTIVMDVPRSPAFYAFTSLFKWTKQKDFVACLRDQLFGCYPSGLLPTMRSVDFSRKNDGSRSIQHGSESLGKSIEMKVQSKSGEIPEYVEFDVPWFYSKPFSDYRGRIQCAIDMDAATECFRIVPRGSEFNVACELSMHSIASEIVASIDKSGEVSCSVVLGTPYPE